jgi:hypothetical protein
MQPEHVKSNTAIFHFVARDKDGNVTWEDTAKNLVTTEGRNDILTKHFDANRQTPTE